MKTQKTNAPRIVGLILEGILAIPFMGMMAMIGLLYMPLLAELAIGIWGLVTQEKKAPFVMLIVTGCLAWIPFLGWMLHVINFVVLLCIK